MEIKRTESFCLNIDGNISRYADKNQRDLQAAAARGEGRNVICFRSVGIWRLPVARLNELYALAEKEGFVVS